MRQEMSKYEMTRASPMQEGLALVDVGWIDWVRAKMMHMAARFAVVATRCRGYPRRKPDFMWLTDEQCGRGCCAAVRQN